MAEKLAANPTVHMLDLSRVPPVPQPPAPPPSAVVRVSLIVARWAPPLLLHRADYFSTGSKGVEFEPFERHTHQIYAIDSACVSVR